MWSSGFEEIITRSQLFGHTNVKGTFSFLTKIRILLKFTDRFWVFSRVRDSGLRKDIYFFKNDIYWLLIFYWMIICTQKIKCVKKRNFSIYIKYVNIVICTVTCYMYLFRWIRIYNLKKSSSKVIPAKKKKSIYGSFLHVLINSFQASPASLKEETITLVVTKQVNVWKSVETLLGWICKMNKSWRLWMALGYFE